MGSAKIGDVFAIQTEKGNAYFQFAGEVKTLGEYIRVFSGLYSNVPDDLSKIINEKESFVLFFRVKPAYIRKLIDRIGNFDIPRNFMLPEYMISSNIIRGRLYGWLLHKVDTWHMTPVKELTSLQKKLSPWGSWNDTFLKERLSEGWTPEKEVEYLLEKYGDPVK